MGIRFSKPNFSVDGPPPPYEIPEVVQHAALVRKKGSSLWMVTEYSECGRAEIKKKKVHVVVVSDEHLGPSATLISSLAAIAYTTMMNQFQ